MKLHKLKKILNEKLNSLKFERQYLLNSTEYIKVDEINIYVDMVIQEENYNGRIKQIEEILLVLEKDNYIEWNNKLENFFNDWYNDNEHEAYIESMQHDYNKLSNQEYNELLAFCNLSNVEFNELLINNKFND